MTPLHRHPVSRLALLAFTGLLAVHAADDDKPFDCHVKIGESQFDLTKVAGEHSVSRKLDLPPSTITDRLTFNLCKDLVPADKTPADEKCGANARACLVRETSRSGGSSSVLSVIQVANSSSTTVTSKILSSPKGVELSFGGAPYPPVHGGDLIPQSFHVKLLCDPEQSEPKFTSYDGKDLSIEWSAPAGCSYTSAPDDDSKPSDGGSEPSPERVGSGLGYFFLLFFLAFAVYFALGAYYNYSTYGATGLDLIPHRDFWREVPYMLRDLVAHLCSAVRPRHSANRGGYMAV
ncbi:autophagy-related protein 27 [Epithele typhae]|uniref:autophagy-related protein 27 n=1 Tax=Epithele typhae TaxID=378194 RepID=UPI00200870D0|nr:autophagy-related protein 27 [Epithele typhae]KAH9942502.1 autophagy-related protein 27 [Epithele typhae]